MSVLRVGIVGAENEKHSLHMRNVLLKKGVEVLIIDTVKFPEEATLSVLENDIIYNGESINDIEVFYIRAVFYSLPPYDLEERRKEKDIDLTNWYVEYVAERERQSHLTSWIRIMELKGKNIINPIKSFDLHYLKPYQIHLLAQNGIRVPKTLVTNDKTELLKFLEANKEVVYKPVAGGAACKKLEKEDLNETKLERLKNAPVLFQEYIDGNNIRVYVLDNEVISANIIFTDSVDYRGHEKSIVPINLPEDVKKMCIKAAQLCGMKFSGIDLKQKLDGEYVLIECNPSPMFLGIVEWCGDPIDEKLADYLIKIAKTKK